MRGFPERAENAGCPKCALARQRRRKELRNGASHVRYPYWRNGPEGRNIMLTCRRPGSIKSRQRRAESGLGARGARIRQFARASTIAQTPLLPGAIAAAPAGRTVPKEVVHSGANRFHLGNCPDRNFLVDWIVSPDRRPRRPSVRGDFPRGPARSPRHSLARPVDHV